MEDLINQKEGFHGPKCLKSTSRYLPRRMGFIDQGFLHAFRGNIVPFGGRATWSVLCYVL